MNFIKSKEPRTLVAIILKEEGVIPSFLIIKIIVSLRNEGMKELSPLPRVMLPLGQIKNIFNCAFREINSFML
jgi:hypothetical protein